jgi:Spy/CpxP family protein refolding chaperone
MKMLTAKMALATTVAMATLLSADAALAQRHYAAPRSNYSWGNQTFSNHDQQIIDQITRTDRSAGY